MQENHLRDTVEALSPFVPAKDFEISKRFYADLGFQVAPLGKDLAGLETGTIPENYFVKEGM